MPDRPQAQARLTNPAARPGFLLPEIACERATTAGPGHGRPGEMAGSLPEGRSPFSNGLSGRLARSSQEGEGQVLPLALSPSPMGFSPPGSSSAGGGREPISGGHFPACFYPHGSLTLRAKNRVDGGATEIQTAQKKTSHLNSLAGKGSRSIQITSRLDPNRSRFKVAEKLFSKGRIESE